jgi:hypothetical protein
MAEYKNSHSLISSLLIAAAIAAIAIVSFIQSEKYIKNTAIDGCLQAGRLETKTNKNENVTIPENYWYTFCMEQKGYKK